jgi:hypothetical protein
MTRLGHGSIDGRLVQCRKKGWLCERGSVRVSVVAVVALLAVAGCGSDSVPAVRHSGSPSPAASSQPSPSSASGLVGEWERRTTCQQRVDALKDAGLGQFAAEHAAGEGWLPGVTSPDDIKDPEHPCRGAVPRKHTHFFTADGVFGSRDEDGDQVDDGTYTVIDEDTVVISKEFGDITFNYRLEGDGDTLLLDPVLPQCIKSGCFAAQWAVAVAYPGLAWRRATL